MRKLKDKYKEFKIKACMQEYDLYFVLFGLYVAAVTLTVTMCLWDK